MRARKEENMKTIAKLAKKLSPSKGYYYAFSGSLTEADNFCYDLQKQGIYISVFVWRDSKNLFVDKIFINAIDPIAQKIDSLLN